MAAKRTRKPDSAKPTQSGTRIELALLNARFSDQRAVGREVKEIVSRGFKESDSTNNDDKTMVSLQTIIGCWREIVVLVLRARLATAGNHLRWHAANWILLPGVRQMSDARCSVAPRSIVWTKAWTGLRLCRTILWIARGRLRPCPAGLIFVVWLLCGVGHSGVPEWLPKEPGNRTQQSPLNPGLGLSWHC